MASQRAKLYGSIVSATCGVVFFGTPHRGSGGAKFSKTCLDIARVVYPIVRSDLVGNLQRTAEALADIGELVPELLEPLIIITAYETRSLDLFSAAGIVISRESALLNISNEMAIPIDTDHRAMCRFSDQNDPRFRPVLLAVSSAIKTALQKSDPLYQACLEALSSMDFQQRRLLLPDSPQSTFEWIWTHSTFTNWLDGDSEILWLRGKPSSGKSTFMKCIREGLVEQIQVGEGEGRVAMEGSHRQVLVDFFYNARGTNVEMEHISMLRSILWQILSQVPAL